jgi:hypothetical protein
MWFLETGVCIPLITVLLVFLFLPETLYASMVSKRDFVSGFYKMIEGIAETK